MNGRRAAPASAARDVRRHRRPAAECPTSGGVRHVRQPLRTTAPPSTSRARPLYIDDMPRAGRHAACRHRRSPASRAGASRRSISTRCARVPGVVAVLTAADIPGSNDMLARRSATTRSSPTDEISFHGQAVFAWSADETRDAARRAARLGRRRRRGRDAERHGRGGAGRAARPCCRLRLRPRRRRCGARDGAAHALDGTFRIGGQEHFYLEGPGRARHPGRGRRHASSIPRRSIRPRCSTSCARVLGRARRAA